MELVIVIAVVVWVASVAGWFMLTKASRSSDIQKVKARLMGLPKEKKEKAGGKQPALFETETQKPGKVIGGLLARYNLNERSQALLEQAGLKWKPHRLVQTCLMAFMATYAASWLFAPPVMRPWLFPLALAGGFAPLLWVMRLRSRRLHQFEAIFPDCLEFVSRSMRAGHAFSVSLEMIYREFQEPLAGEFRRTFEEHNLGLPLDTALQKLAARVPLLDVHFFVSAVLLQKRTGGNLAEILDKLAYVIRERFKLRGRIRAVSAHGRMTGIALTCIPIGVGVLMSFTNPDYITFFWKDEIGQMLGGAGITLQLIGYAVIQKIVRIEV